MPNLMVVGAHHDDCEWKAGGLSLILKQIGWQLKFLVVTNTAVGHSLEKVAEESSVQKEKGLKSAGILGVEKCFLDFPSLDDSVRESEVTARLAEEFAEYEPDMLVCDWPRSSHPDHRLAGVAALNAWRRPMLASKPRRKEIAEILCYCAYTYGKVEPNFLINITEHWNQVCQALKSFPEFENPRGNNLILSKDTYYIEGNLYWEHIEKFVLIKGHPERITVLADLLHGRFRWLQHDLPEELVF